MTPGVGARVVFIISYSVMKLFVGQSSPRLLQTVPVPSIIVSEVYKQSRDAAWCGWAALKKVDASPATKS